MKKNIKPIRTEEDYQNALIMLEDIFDAPKGTADNDRADILVTLIDKYESENYIIDTPDPIEAIKIRMDEMGLKPKDLMEMIGAKSRGTISNILSRRRSLTLPIIRQIGPKLGLSFDILIKEYEIAV